MKEKLNCEEKIDEKEGIKIMGIYYLMMFVFLGASISLLSVLS